jgi:hypothetical protein
MNYGPIGSNHFSHQSAVMVLQVADAILFGGFLGFFFSADCGINFECFNFYTTRASHKQIVGAADSYVYLFGSRPAENLMDLKRILLINPSMKKMRSQLSYFF